MGNRNILRGVGGTGSTPELNKLSSMQKKKKKKNALPFGLPDFRTSMDFRTSGLQHFGGILLAYY